MVLTTVVATAMVRAGLLEIKSTADVILLMRSACGHEAIELIDLLRPACRDRLLDKLTALTQREGSREQIIIYTIRIA